MRALLLPTLLLPSVALAELPAGAVISDAVVVDIPDEGFAAVGDALPGLVPPSFDVPEVHLYDYEETCVWGVCVTWYEYQVDATNGTAYFDVDYLDLTPGVDVLNLDAQITVSVNSSADPLDLYLYGEGLGLIGDSWNCDVWVEPFPVTVWGAVSLQIVNGALDAVVPTPTYELGLDSSDIKVSGCLIGDIEAVLNFFGLSMYDLVIDMVEPEIDAAIADIPDQIETLIEDSFAAATISEEIDLMGTPLTVDIAPESIQIVNDGMRLSMAGSFYAPPDPCVADFGSGGSLETPSSLPGVGGMPGGLPFDPHLAVYADDDFLNSALYAVWNAGLLCYEIDDDSELELPLAINTALLGLLAPGVYDELFPETAPMSIVTRPEQPPIVVADGSNDVNLEVRDLGLEMYAELEGRQTRLVNIDLAIDAGVDVTFDDLQGELALDVLLDGGRITPTVTFNEYTPDANGTLEGSFLGLFDQIVAPLLGDALGGLAFPIPAFEGIGLTGMAIEPAGSAADRVGAYAGIGSDVAYYDPNAPAGCGCEGEDSGCDTGCSTGGLPSRSLPLLFPLVLVALRRRNR